MKDCNWIKLHRKMTEWEWYDDIPVKVLFFHCLIKANHKDKTWRGIEIKRGEFLTSLESLKKETGLSVSQIRTAIKKLNMTGEIANKSQSSFRLIQIKNYNDYQDNRKQDSNEVTNESQTNDKPMTTTKNEKNEKKQLWENFKIFELLKKWLAGFENVRSPEGFANGVRQKYSEKIIERALNDSSTTSISAFYQNLNFYKKKHDQNL